MTKKQWQEHFAAVGAHDQVNCPQCAARRATKRKNMAQRQRDDAMRSCGLVKVRGALGGTYWE